MSRRFCFAAAVRLIFPVALCVVIFLSNPDIKTAADGISGGNGSCENPYIIASVSGLQSIEANPGANYRLGSDINLNGCSWVPLCGSSNGFTGMLDGNHHVIENFRLTSDADYAGLFGCIGSTGVVENLGIDSGQVTSRYGEVGGITGLNYGAIKSCYNKATIKSTAAMHCLGGITAINYGSVSNCFNTGIINGKSTSTAGGIVGQNLGNPIVNCYNTGKIGSADVIGGITGTGQCENCHFLAQDGLFETGDGSSFAYGETAQALKTQSTYAQWDFDSIWRISADLNNGYPCFISLSGDAALSAITLSSGALSPDFSPDTFYYTATVGYDVSSVTVAPVASDEGASVLVNESATDYSVPLNTGGNTVTVTVTAQDGTFKTYTLIITRAASGDAALSAITLSSGTLSPDFSPDTFYYTATVGYDVSSVTVAPVASDEGASVLVNGSATDYSVPLNTGGNTVTVTVTAQDGTFKTYTLIITRAASGDAALSAITLSSGALSPDFSPDTFYYTATVGYDVSSVTVAPVASDEGASVLVNGSATDYSVPLNTGGNTVTVTVTAQDGTFKTYTLIITRAASGDAALSAITLSSGALSPDFSPDTFYYTANVGYDVSSVTVAPVASDKGASVLVNGSATDYSVPLNTGGNTVTVTVTAQDGTFKTYTLIITRTASSDAALSAITLSSGALSPDFSPDTFYYTANVGYDVSSVTVTPVASDEGSSVLVNGSASDYSVPLNTGGNTVTVTVTAQDGALKTYTLIITRAASGDAALSAITLSSGALSPDFRPDTFYYTANVDYGVSYIAVIPTAADISSTVSVNGSTSDCAVALNVGGNTVTVTVTAQDGSSKTYTVIITRVTSGSAALSAISLSSGALSPAFSPETTYYTANVDHGVSYIAVIPTAASTDTTVLINGSTSDCAVALNVGGNTVTVTVTAQDGSSRTYTVIITRAAAGSAGLSSMVLSSGTLSPIFSTDTTYYSVSVDYSVLYVAVFPTAADAGSTVLVNGNEANLPVALAVGGNIIQITVTTCDDVFKTYTVIITRGYSKQITAASTDSSGDYTAEIPDYASALNGNDTFSFVLGSITVALPVYQLQLGLSAGGAEISKATLSQSAGLDVVSNEPDGVVTADAFSLKFSGGLSELSATAGVTISFDSDIKNILSNGYPEIYYYDPVAHTFTNMNASFDMTALTAKFNTGNFGTFVIAVQTSHEISYHYALLCDSVFSVQGTSAEFSVTVVHESGSAALYGGQLLVVTELKSGNQTFLTVPISKDTGTLKISVDGTAVKSSVYLIRGNFDGNTIPWTYSLAVFVTC